MKNYTEISTPKRFFYNGLAASSSSLLLRFCSMLFNVYLSNSAGAETMGLLSLIYSVWSFVLTAGCAGGALASTRLSAESRSLGEDEFISALRCMRYSLISGSLAGCLLFFCSPAFGILLSESRAISSLRILSLSLPFIAMSGSLSGYFDSTDNAYKNSVIRICEQAVRITATVLVLTAFSSGDAEDNCKAIITGGAVAEIFSFFALLLLFKNAKGKSACIGKPSSVNMKKIAAITVPVTISSAARSGLVSIEHMLIPIGLQTFGFTRKESLELFGVVHGMALPVILFCIAIPSAFASLLIPNFAKHNTEKNIAEIRYIASRAYRSAFVFSIGVAGYLVLSAFLLGNILYPGTDSAHYIYVFAPLIPVMYVDSVSDSLLKGMGEQVYSMKINIMDAAISVGLVFFLVPRIGISGYIIAIYASEIFNTCTSFMRVFRLTEMKIPIFRFIISPLIASVITARICAVLYGLFEGHGDKLSAILGGMSFTLIYILLLNISGNVNREEKNYYRQLLTQK